MAAAQIHAATLELPLEGPLLTGGLTFVLHVPPSGWHARERSGKSDFFVSTREVSEWSFLNIKIGLNLKLKNNRYDYNIELK